MQSAVITDAPAPIAFAPSATTWLELVAIYLIADIALPVMMASLTVLLSAPTERAPILAASAFVTAAGMLVFAFKLYRNVAVVAARSQALSSNS